MYSLSNRHELFQSFLRSGADLRCKVQVVGATDFHPHLYSENFQRLKAEHGFNFQECIKTVFKGTAYSKGDIITLNQQNYQYQVEMGQIRIILFDSMDKIYFLVEKLETTFVPYLRVYKSGAAMGYDCIICDKLLSPYPLHVYQLNGYRCVRLNHALVSKDANCQ